MEINILLFGYHEDTPSFANLENALTHLGKILILPEKDGMHQVLEREYDLIILDASYINNETLIVSKIRAQQPQARIIILTASPTWRRAREAFQAGASDYIKKSLSEREYVSIFEKVLSRSSSSSNQ